MDAGGSEDGAMKDEVTDSKAPPATSEGGQPHMVVPSAQVDTFLATLKSYSDFCEGARIGVEKEWHK